MTFKISTGWRGFFLGLSEVRRLRERKIPCRTKKIYLHLFPLTVRFYVWLASVNYGCAPVYHPDLFPLAIFYFGFGYAGNL